MVTWGILLRQPHSWPAAGPRTDPEAYDAYEVSEGPKGLEEARDALKAAMREACEAGAAWPKLGFCGFR